MKGNLTKRLLALLLVGCMLFGMLPAVHAATSSALKTVIAGLPALKPNNQYVGYPTYDANQKNFSNLNKGTYLLVTDTEHSGSRYVLNPYASAAQGTIGASPVQIVGNTVVGADPSWAVTLENYVGGANGTGSAAATYTVRFQDNTYLNLTGTRKGVTRGNASQAITFYAHYGHGGMHIRYSGDFMLYLNTGVTANPYFDLQKDHYTSRTDLHLYKLLTNQLNTEPIYNAIKAAEPYVKYGLLPDDSMYQGFLTCLESAVNLYKSYNGGTYTAAKQTELDNKTRDLTAELNSMPLDLQTAANVAKMNSYALQLVSANAYNATSFTWDSEGKTDRWRYFNGLMMDALQMVGQKTYTANFYNSVISSNGTVSAWNDGHIDSIEPVRALLDLLDTSYSAKFKSTIAYAINELNHQITYSNCGGNYTHQQGLVNGKETVSSDTSYCWHYWTIALDGLYMALPFLMECAREMDKGTLTISGKTAAGLRTDVYNRLIWVCDNLYNSSKGLYHHAWSTSASKGNGKYWSRGTGWLAMAMVDTIALMPAGAQRTNLINRLTKIFDGMLNYQDSASGMWYNMTTYNTSLTSGNYFKRTYTLDNTEFTNVETHVNDLETSGTAMMAYAMMMAYNNGWVGSKYGDAGLKAFNGTINTYMEGYEGNYAVYGSYKAGWARETNEEYLYSTYERNEAKGIAPLIMASTLANATMSGLMGENAVLSGNDTVIIAKNGTPNYSKLKLVITYTDGSTKTVTTSNGLTVAAVDSSKPGIYDLTVSYDGVSYGSVRVIITDGNATQADGSVTISKSATGVNFVNTGGAKVELTAKGSTVQMGMDVILIVDVSNSMAWDMDWFNGGTNGKSDRYRLPSAQGTTKTGWYDSYEQKGGSDKLDVAMEAATQFANSLLKDNQAGNTAGNNTLTFVTFAGHDTDNDGGYYDYTTDLPKDMGSEDVPIVDSVQTVFAGVDKYEDAKRSFENTYFYKTTAGQYKFAYDTAPDTEYYLQIAGTDGQAHLFNHSYGVNRGNTNYDYAFWQAKNAAQSMQSSMASKLGASAYSATGRETVVIFMTDGAPSHYNNVCWDSRGIDDKTPGTNTSYPKLINTGINWGDYLMANTNTHAVALSKLVGGFYTVGFDLAHGGQANFGTTEAQAADLLGGLVSKASNARLPVHFAETVNDLLSSFGTMAAQIRYAAMGAVVTDEIGTNYTLLMTQSTGTSASTYRGNLGVAPTVEVSTYKLNQNGNRTGSATVLEKLTFNSAGTAAYSNVLGSSTNILTTSNGTTTISAKYFTYTKTSAGKETFTWKIGDIGDREFVFSYYVYLKNAMGENGGRAGGTYATNNSATIKYINKEYKYTTLTYPVPTLQWGSATVKYEYYLVNKAGKPVNRNGQEVTFANRVVISGPTSKTYALNTSTKITASAPNGYILYDTSANFTAKGSSGTAHTGSLSISAPSADAKKLGQTGAQTTKQVSATSTTFAVTHVAFGVLSSTPVTVVDTVLASNKVVIDYGLPVLTDIMGNNSTPTQNAYGADYSAYTATVVGFVAYNGNTDLKQFQSNAGSASYTGSYGVFTVVGNEVRYSPNKMLSNVERVFCVVKFTGSRDSFYLYDELAIFPATVMYYESNFGSNVFSFTGKGTGANAWSQKTLSGTPATDLNSVNQDRGDVPASSPVTYGYDSNYASGLGLSMGRSHYVVGVGLPKFNSDYTPNYSASANYVEASFSFTGTGFDLISRTGEKQGAIRVVVYRNNVHVTNKTVLNKSDSKLELYQIPVISIHDLPYGTYTVKIFVNEPFSYADLNGGVDPFGGALDRGGEFYLDAVRIYSPIDTSDTALANNAVSREAYSCYESHKEQDPNFVELRQFLIDADSYSAGGTMTGAVYLDSNKTDDGSTEEGSDADVDGTQVYMVGNYAALGPNNETYLKKNQAVAFKLNVLQPVPASVDIGAKSADGVSPVLGVTLSSTKPGSTSSGLSKTVASTTAQFYDIDIASNMWTTESDGSKSVYVVIRNTGNGILSITDIKFTGTLAGTAQSVQLLYDANLVHVANALIAGGEELPQIQHSFTHSDLDPEVHTLTCVICGYSRWEAHSYVNGLCSCGREDPTEPKVQESWKLSHTLNLASDISLSYVIPKESCAGYDNLYLTVEKEQYEGNFSVGTDIFRLSPVERGDYYYFTLEGLTAVEMNDILTARLYGEKDGAVYVSQEDSYSISTYAYTQLGRETASESLKVLCAELLRYGSAAQIYKGYRTDALPDARLTAEQRALLADLDSVTFGNHNGEGSELAQPQVQWKGKALDLNTKLSLRFVVDVKDYGGSVENLSLRICYTDTQDETVTAVVTEATPYGSGGTLYAFTFDGLMAAEFRTVLTATVYEGEIPVSNSLTYSADTYGNGKTDSLLNLCKAVFAYSDAANRYFS